ncbi:MAG: efflux transporter, family, subunit [Verrucomicrobia bacterium]|nr:efflux transporter, family, subunit [Verrucomicrobiota bacterium]
MASSKSHSGLIVFLVILVAAGGAGWYFWKANSEKPAEYTSAPVTRGELTQSVTATGTLQAVTTVDVSSQISGNIAKLYVDWNSPVKKDQVLAEIDPSNYQTALKQAAGQLANAEANFALMKANADRSKNLFDQKLIPQSDLDTAIAQLAQAEAQVQIQSAAHDTAQVNLTRCTIHSPIDGSVILRSVDVGNTVAASLSAPVLFQIANDLRTMQIDAAISEADIGNIQEKQHVTFTVDAYPNRQFHGVVSQIRNSPKTTQNVVVYDTMIDVPNPDLKLKPGMTASVSIIVANHSGVLKVPNGALRTRIPESLLPPKPAPDPKSATAAAAKPAAKPLTDEERRQKMQDLMRDAGFVRGNGPPSPEVTARIQELAKERGIELPAGRFGGRSGDTNAPVTRTLYLLRGVGTDAHPEPVTVKLGISDGTATEAIEGLNEGDPVITSAVIPGAKGSAPATNPFGGQSNQGGRRGF